MKTSRFISTLLLIAQGLIAQVEIKAVSFFGYDDAIELSNEYCKVIVTPGFGGKVMYYGMIGHGNVLELDDEERGFVLDRENPQSIFDGGGRFDLGPQGSEASDPLHTIGPWQVIRMEANQVVIESEVSQRNGLQIRREFILDENSSSLRVDQKVFNRGRESIVFNYWSRTFAKGGGVSLIPMSEGTFYPLGYAHNGSDGLQFRRRVEDPNVFVKEGYVIVTGQPKYPKMGVENFVGWAAYWTPGNGMFLKEFPTYPDQPYIDLASGTYSLYYNENYLGHSVAELEPIGPKVTLSPGEESHFYEVWSLLDMPIPEKGGIDPESIRTDLNKLGFALAKPTYRERR